MHAGLISVRAHYRVERGFSLSCKMQVMRHFKYYTTLGELKLESKAFKLCLCNTFKSALLSWGWFGFHLQFITYRAPWPFTLFSFTFSTIGRVHMMSTCRDVKPASLAFIQINYFMLFLCNSTVCTIHYLLWDIFLHSSCSLYYPEA